LILLEEQQVLWDFRDVVDKLHKLLFTNSHRAGCQEHGAM